MESRSRKKTKEDQNQHPLYSDASTLHPVISDDQLRPWSDLPQDLLVSILTLLASWSLPDLLSASFVCRRWRSIAAAAAASFSVPSLLLVPFHCPRPAQSHIQILAPTPKSYRSPIPSKTVRKRCVGSSSGRLIFISGNIAIISDPFTGQEIHSPNLPSQLYVLGLLTSQSSLLLLSNSSNISFWRFGTEYWREIVLAGSISGRIVSVAVVKDDIFCLDSFCNLLLVKLDPCVEWKRLRMPPPGGTFMHHRKLAQHLVECGGELLLVIFVATGKNQAYRLDRSRYLWMDVESLGNWCLFVHRKQVVAAPHPTIPARWGGTNGCVYFISPGIHTTEPCVADFDGGVIDTRGCYPFNKTDLFPWPSPVWIFPNVHISNVHSRQNGENFIS